MTNPITTDLALRDLLEATNQLRQTVLNLSAAVMESTQAPRTVGIDALATATGLHPDTVKKHIESGKLPGQKIDGRYVIPDLEFDSWRRGEWQPRAEAIRPPRKMLHDVAKTG